MTKQWISFLTLTTLAGADPVSFQAKVVRIIDGDTVLVQQAAEEQKVRLDSIDAPERKQAGGQSSRRALADSLPPGSPVRVEALGKDRYGRILAQLYRPDGINVNALQVRNGQAWVFTRYCRDMDYWKPLEDRARKQRLGLWAAPKPVPPWEFRHPPRP
jgi:endonuclease YncB( thermonuclease family)